MSSGGSIQAMVTAMKNNARRRKTSSKSMVGVKAGALYKKGTYNVQHSTEKVEAFKKAYREKAVKENRKRRFLLICVITLTPFLCYWIVQLIWLWSH
ncbi:hypothetical protein [Nonlabens antarcticus]|uniref:hypothetical protein n=1 Tax=Nonlabens antarcticus TaxID=392714 RepID=UPI001890ECDC|nr:hypothetical protein [Nonlabens antarcticus]